MTSGTRSKRKYLLPGLLILVMVLGILLQVWSKNQLSFSEQYQQRQAEREAEREAEAALKQELLEMWTEDEPSSRAESVPVQPATAFVSQCRDPQNDDTSTQGVLDIDRAEASVEGEKLVVRIVVHPVKDEGLKVSSYVTLTSVVDPNLWVRYSNNSSLFGRIGTDNRGDAKNAQIEYAAEGTDTIKMSIPLVDFAELGDEISWEASIRGQWGPHDECPNDGQRLVFKLSYLKDAAP